ncbi:porin [Algibacter marinivivus]|uniref:Porin n=1 Tax=Algibacter marinivivus TaxID=2100723 RepID=A0A2U2X8J7_9FLAO|nr:outer membrane beta-barrel protein [Algibacter marinivivus]PWH84109.1 porin [Algibacter marinivivus]
MKKIITLSMLFVATALFAQEEATKKLNFSGSVDTYYRTVLTASDALSPATESSFADQTGFALGMANIIASYEGDKTGVVADLAFGTRGLQAVGGGTDVFINQLYAYWNVSEGTTLTLGRFNTYLGYEVISPVGNFNYSTSYMFSYGPFSHVGLKADFALSDDFSLMTAIMNVTDVNNNTTGDYALGAQLGYAGQFLNFYYDGGAGIGFEVDYTGGFDLSDDFYLGINAAYQDNDGAGFYGAALYPQLATSDAFTIGLRAEYFQQLEDGGVLAALPADESILGVTLTGSYTLENLIIKPELRLDSASEEVVNFPDSDGAPSKSLAAFTLAAIYSF